MRLGLPRDAAQWVALALGLVALALVPRLLALRDPAKAPSRRVVLAVIAALAAALSAAYVAVYLRDGPRIIDATSYWLEARALSHGLLSWRVAEPAASIVGRFLVRAPSGAVSVIFPPGYPALLAVGFASGAPLAVGPIVAAALVLATASLAARLEGATPDGPARADLPIVAALLSLVCAALRYHTADTMSHGLAALCFVAALALSFAALDRAPARAASLHALAAGLFSGWLVATRPVSALALGAGLALALVGARTVPSAARVRLAAALALGALPGALLLAAHQRAATGGFGASSQSLYYALSDGPPGCFGYGFGPTIGCVGEHGDFVRAHLHDGFGALAAAGTTLRRLWLHLVDALNAEPLALLVPAGAWIARRSPRARLLAACVGLQIAAYVPFYFDGNYPGGGARFFADVLPLEHVLAALAIVALARRAPSPERRSRRVAAVIGLACLGFAVRAGFDHALLRDREGGLPMYEPARVAAAGVSRGLLFTTTDHGFALAHDPGGSGPLEVLRLRGDGLDRLAWEARGEPEAHIYDFVIPAGGGPAEVTLRPYSPGALPLTIEGESLWPAVRQDAAWALPEYASGTCASHGRWLRVRRKEGAAVASVELALPASLLRGACLTPRIALDRPGFARVRAIVDGESFPLAEVAPASAEGLCRELASFEVPSGATDVRLALEPGEGAELFALDALGVARKKPLTARGPP